MEKIIELSGHKPDIIDFAQLADAPKEENTENQKPKQKKEKKEKTENKEKKDKKGDKDEEDHHMLGITIKREENFSEWYSQVITKSEMIEYYDVSG